MKQIVISEEEAKIIVKTLRTNWIPLNDQKVVYNLIGRLEKEIEN